MWWVACILIVQFSCLSGPKHAGMACLLCIWSSIPHQVYEINFGYLCDGSLHIVFTLIGIFILIDSLEWIWIGCKGFNNLAHVLLFCFLQN